MVVLLLQIMEQLLLLGFQLLPVKYVFTLTLIQIVLITLITELEL